MACCGACAAGKPCAESGGLLDSVSDAISGAVGSAIARKAKKLSGLTKWVGGGAFKPQGWLNKSMSLPDLVANTGKSKGGNLLGDVLRNGPLLDAALGALGVPAPTLVRTAATAALSAAADAGTPGGGRAPRGSRPAALPPGQATGTAPAPGAPKPVCIGPSGVRPTADYVSAGVLLDNIITLLRR